MSTVLKVNRSSIEEIIKKYGKNRTFMRCLINSTSNNIKVKCQFIIL